MCSWAFRLALYLVIFAVLLDEGHPILAFLGPGFLFILDCWGASDASRARGALKQAAEQAAFVDRDVDLVAFLQERRAVGELTDAQWTVISARLDDLRAEARQLAEACGAEPATQEQRFARRLKLLQELRKSGNLGADVSDTILRTLARQGLPRLSRAGTPSSASQSSPPPAPAPLPVPIPAPAPAPAPTPVAEGIVFIDDEKPEAPVPTPEPAPAPVVASAPIPIPIPIQSQTTAEAAVVVGSYVEPTPRPVSPQPTPPLPRPTPPPPPPEPKGPSLLSAVLDAFMEEGNVKWVEVLASVSYLVAFSIGLYLLASSWEDFSPVWRYGAVLGVTCALGLAALAARRFLGLVQTAQALGVVVTLLVPLNFLAVNYLCFRDLQPLVPVPWLVGTVVLALVVLGALHRASCGLVSAEVSPWYQAGYLLLSAPSAIPLGGTEGAGVLLLTLGAVVAAAVLAAATRERAARGPEPASWTSFYPAGTLAFVLFVHAVTLGVIDGLAAGPSFYGLFLVLLATLGFTYALARDLEPRTRPVVVAALGVSLLGVAVAASGGLGANLPLTASLAVATVLYTGWTAFTGFSGMAWTAAATLVGLYLAARADLGGSGVLSYLGLPFVLAAGGAGAAGLRRRVLRGRPGEPWAVAQPFFGLLGALAALLTVAALLDWGPGRVVTGVLAAGAGAAALVLPLRIVWWVASLEAWLCALLVAGTQGGIGAAGPYRELAPALAGLALAWATVGWLLRERSRATTTVAALQGLDDVDPFCSVALLSTALGCAALVGALGLVFGPPLAPRFILAAAVLALAQVPRRATVASPWHEYVMAAFMAYAALLGPVLRYAPSVGWMVAGLAAVAAFLALLAAAFRQPTRDYQAAIGAGRPGGPFRHGLADVALVLGLLALCALAPWPFNPWFDRWAAVATALALALGAAFVGRVYPFWPSLWLCPALLVLAVDAGVTSALTGQGRLVGLAFVSLAAVLLGRTPSVRRGLGRTARRLDGPRRFGARRDPLADVALVVTALTLLCLGPAAFAGSPDAPGPIALALAGFADVTSGPPVAARLAAAAALGSALVLLARRYRTPAWPLAAVGFALVALDAVGEGLALVPADRARALLQVLQPPALLVAAWALRPAWGLVRGEAGSAARAVSWLLGAWALVVAWLPLWVGPGGEPRAIASRLAAYALAAGLFVALARRRSSLLHEVPATAAVVGLGGWVAWAAYYDAGLQVPGASSLWGAEAWPLLEGLGLVVAAALLAGLSTFHRGCSDRAFRFGAVGALAVAVVLALTAEGLAWWELAVRPACPAAGVVLAGAFGVAWLLEHRAPTREGHEAAAGTLLGLALWTAYALLAWRGADPTEDAALAAGAAGVVVGALALLFRHVALCRRDPARVAPWNARWDAGLVTRHAQRMGAAAAGLSVLFASLVVWRYRLGTTTHLAGALVALGIVAAAWASLEGAGARRLLIVASVWSVASLAGALALGFPADYGCPRLPLRASLAVALALGAAAAALRRAARGAAEPLLLEEAASAYGTAATVVAFLAAGCLVADHAAGSVRHAAGALACCAALALASAGRGLAPLRWCVVAAAGWTVAAAAAWLALGAPLGAVAGGLPLRAVLAVALALAASSAAVRRAAQGAREAKEPPAWALLVEPELLVETPLAFGCAGALVASFAACWLAADHAVGSLRHAAGALACLAAFVGAWAGARFAVFRWCVVVAAGWAAASAAAWLSLGLPRGAVAAPLPLHAALAMALALALVAEAWRRRGAADEALATTLAVQVAAVAVAALFLRQPCQPDEALAAFIVLGLVGYGCATVGRAPLRWLFWGAATWAVLVAVWVGMAAATGDAACPWHGGAGSFALVSALSALALALLAHVFKALAAVLERPAGESPVPWLRPDEPRAVATVLAPAALGVLMLGMAPRPGPVVVAAVLATAAAFAWFFLGEAWRLGSESSVYVGLAGLPAAYVYLRETGVIGVTFFGQLGVLVAAFALLGVAARAAGGRADVFARPCFRVALALPLLVVWRAGFGAGTPVRWLGDPPVERFGLLAAAAAFYALAAPGVPWSTLLSLALGNLGLGILAFHKFGCTDPAAHFDVYSIPAGLSLVWFSRIHAGWFGPAASRHARLVGLVVVYAAPTWHCFAGADVVRFYVLLALGLVGFLAGLAFRIRHFFAFGLLFIGVALVSFLLNIVQLAPTTFTLLFFLLLGVGFTTHAALLRLYRDRYQAVLDGVARWE